MNFLNKLDLSPKESTIRCANKIVIELFALTAEVVLFVNIIIS